MAIPNGPGAQTSPEELAALKAAADRYQQIMGQGAPPASPWGAPPNGGAPAAPEGVGLPLRVPLPDGRDYRITLWFGPQYANPNALIQLVGELMQAGLPLDIYQPKQQWGGNGGGGWQQRGFNGGGGGFGGGGRFGGRFGGGGGFGGGGYGGGWR